MAKIGVRPKIVYPKPFVDPGFGDR